MEGANGFPSSQSCSPHVKQNLSLGVELWVERVEDREPSYSGGGGAISLLGESGRETQKDQQELKVRSVFALSLQPKAQGVPIVNSTTRDPEETVSTLWQGAEGVMSMWGETLFASCRFLAVFNKWPCQGALFKSLDIFCHPQHLRHLLDHSHLCVYSPWPGNPTSNVKKPQENNFLTKWGERRIPSLNN